MREAVSKFLLRDMSVGEVRPSVRPFAELAVARPQTIPNMPLLAAEARYLAAGVSEVRRTAALVPGALYDARCNVVLARPGRVLRESENVWREFPDVSFHRRYYWRYHYARPRRDLDGICMAFRSPANNYYHTLIDNLPRLYWLHQQKLRDTPVRVLMPGTPHPWEAYFLSKLLPSHAELNQIDPAYLWRAEHMVVGEYLSEQMSGALPRAYLDFFLPRVLPARPRQRRHRIYISRRQAPGGRRILNEDAVRTCMEARGFGIYLLETLDIAQQIDLFYDARVVVAPHGAGLTNTLFSKAIDLVELHPTQAIMPHYYFMARAMGHRYHALCANESNRHSSFAVDISGLEKQLDRIERDHAGEAGYAD